MIDSSGASIDIVLIGRNEGERLRASLESIKGVARQIVYVDSGSTDGSIEAAKSAGALVVELCQRVPFTAARARNAGYHALDSPEFVQFIDGDCVLINGFLEKARFFLLQNEDLAVVTGWRSEIHPERSVYNLLCNWEWRRPSGEIEACGGDMMVRAKAFDQIGGFDPTVIAAEDDEFCLRLGQHGWRLWRIPEEMTRHDADMTTFGQWWKRAERAGHAFAQVGHMHRGYFWAQRKRALIFGLVIPALALTWVPWTLVIAVALYCVSFFRSVKTLRNDKISDGNVWFLGFLLTISKFPNVIGMSRYYLRLLAQKPFRIIEYK